jgi:hypothetical protein
MLRFSMRNLAVLAIPFVILHAFPEQLSAPAALQNENHHRLVFENQYARVYRVSIPANDAITLHQHDFPGLAVSVGPENLVDAVAGKHEKQIKLSDIQVLYYTGSFAHVVRSESNAPSISFFIELLRPQGDARNLCATVVEGPLNDCSSSDSGKPPANSPLRLLAKAMEIKNLFETNEIRATSYSLALQQTYTESGKQPARLLITGECCELTVSLPNEKPTIVHGGEFFWIDAGKQPKIVTPGGPTPSRFVIISFKDSVE